MPYNKFYLKKWLGCTSNIIIINMKIITSDLWRILESLNLLFFKTRHVLAAGWRTPGFLKLFWFACPYACVSVCLSPESIYDQWHDMV